MKLHIVRYDAFINLPFYSEQIAFEKGYKVILQIGVVGLSLPTIPGEIVIAAAATAVHVWVRDFFFLIPSVKMYFN